MRICFLQSQGHMSSGGQGVYGYYLTREYTRMGHEVHVIAGPPYQETAPEVHLHRLKTYSYWGRLAALLWGYQEYATSHPLELFHPLNFYEYTSTRYSAGSLLNMFSLRALEKLNELERQRPFDIVHDNQTLGYGTWLIGTRGRPVVATLHHPIEFDQQNELLEATTVRRRVRLIVQYPWRMQRFVAPRLDRVITDSAASAASIEQIYRLPRERIRVIPVGVDVDVFRPLELKREPNSLLFVGHADDSKKGIRYLLRALASFKGRVPFHLTVVQWPGSHRARRLADELGLSDYVTFRERLSAEELVEQYNRAQVLVSPSLVEGFGLPAAEAMACGAAVIATTASSFPEVIEDGVTGVLVPPADARPLADAIEALLSDPGRCRALGAAGHQRVLERFTWRRTAGETLAVYEEVLGSARVAAR
ncbi:MAG: glycosyltransferase family 4 protein [Dehalococcoidia bacterium]